MGGGIQCFFKILGLFSSVLVEKIALPVRNRLLSQATIASCNDNIDWP